jgi:hypothetical protein
VADKEVEVRKTTTPAVRSGNKLSMPSRVTAYALGITSLGAGGVAVFITHVEAGPVALLFVGLIFMIIAMSGHLPTRLKIGENEAEWQEVAGDIIETALDSATPSTKAEVAPQLEKLAEVAPRAAAAALSGFAYESSFLQIVAVAALKLPDFEQAQAAVRLDQVGEFDLVVQATDNRFILFEVKASPRLSMAQAAAIIEKAHFYRQAYPDRKVGLLLVSKYPLPAAVRAMFMQTPNAACLVVHGFEDEGALIAAINGLLSNLG